MILDAGSEAMKTWIDPSRTTWSKDLQSLLKPYDGELECYQVSKDVGKVGNNSSDFIIPIDSKENKNNIANFFVSPKKKNAEKEAPISQQSQIKSEANPEENESLTGIKRERSGNSPEEDTKKPKLQHNSISPSPQKPKMRSATHNTPKKAANAPKPTDGSQRITNFFKK